MDNLTCETIVGNQIIEWLLKQPNVTILSYHPTSSKSYQGDLIRISKLTPEGLKTKKRFHIDIIFIKDDKLCLAELKCRLSESNDDIEKLSEIEKSYTLGNLLEIISSRSSAKTVLTNIKSLVKIIGVRYTDTTFPQDFIVLSADNGGVEVIDESDINVFG